MANVRKMLDLSTAHLTEDMRTELNCLDLREGNFAGGAFDGVVIYTTEHGGLMWVPQHPEEHAREQEDGVNGVLLAIQLRARRLGCDYVLFDADAAADDELDLFEEEDAGVAADGAAR
jgi:hypothetical protein